MMRSLFSGVSGLRIHQTKMDVIANNIANVNTVGYKSSRVTFTDVFNQTLGSASGPNNATGRGGMNPMQVGLGASVSSIDKLMTGGATQRTDNPYDLMIQGDGFFIVSDASGTYFTRAGALNLDEYGNLVDASGRMVMGWDTDASGENIVRDQVKPISITGDKEYAPAAVTTDIEFSGNLNAATNPIHYGTVSFFDSIGNRYVANYQLEYKLVGGNATWEFSIIQSTVGGNTYDAYLEGDMKTGGVNLGLTLGTNKVITFDANALPKDGFPTTIEINVPAANAAALSPPSNFGDAGKLIMNFSNLRQYGHEQANAKADKFNGSAPGTINGVSIAPDGKVYGRYTNGSTKLLAQIPVAIFKNPAGLEKVGNNLFVQTANSGWFDGIGQDVQLSGGAMQGGALEMANVDLSYEFTEMITTQRGFQANSRIITVSDEMLQELVNLKR